MMRGAQRLGAAARDWLVRSTRLRDAYRRALGPETPHGRLVLADLRRRNRGGENAMTAGDPYATAYTLGRQAAYADILTCLNVTDEEIHETAERMNDGEIDHAQETGF